uniref:Polypeptide N-acetylgalactosaminyltransferase n=1 Tax=Trichobilharzia regenti TaxID=157069 RepID=A0AA85J4N8_TRIRE|nr:unnamed protein product [Trichobilharzia regenti]
MRLHPLRLVRSSLLCFLILFCLVGLYHKFAGNHLSKSENQNANELLSLNKQYKLAERIDWENYTFSAIERSRRGPGENGMAVRLSSEEKEMSVRTQNKNGFSIYVSQKIKVDRSIKDIRHPKCIGTLYSSVLPQASVIIPVFNEHWETLLRTISSVRNRAPSSLLKEIILVDDGSSREYLKDKLDNFLASAYPDGKVRAIHLKKREGLIRAKLAGAKEATGDVLIFLDSHCEASTNWLPPLLDPIAENYRTVVCPFIDVIDADNFEYRAQDEGARGAFDWELYYKRLPRLPEDRNHPEKPFDSPVMAGGLFAISAKWFWELGGYDPGLVIWGGEQYELSFKIWMCGGRMIDAPCSRIGHIYRKYQTDFPKADLGNFVTRNHKRVAEVWMDEYKEYVYRRQPYYRNVDTGDLSAQHELRKRLQCKSFKWFITEIAFDLIKKYPLIEPVPLAVGEIRSVADPSLCLDALGATENVPVRLRPCIKDRRGSNGVQNFAYNYHEDIRIMNKKSCLDVPNVKDKASIVLYPCHEMHGNQHWKIKPTNGNKQNPINLIHPESQYCLDSHPKELMVYVSRCDYSSPTQSWNWETIQFDVAEKSLKEAGL